MNFNLSDEVVNFRKTSLAIPREAIEANNIQIAKLSRATIISVLIEDIAPAIKQIKISGETKRSSSNTFTDNEFKLFKKDIIGFEVSLGNAAKPKPAKIEPVITLRVWPVDASVKILVGTKLFQKFGLETFSGILEVEMFTFISVTSSINLPIDNLPSGDKIPGFEYIDIKTAKKEKAKTNINIVINKVRANLIFPPPWDWSELLKIVLIEITTADKTSGIAGKEINCINVKPKSFKGSDKDGKNLPIKIDMGKITNKKNFGFLSDMRKDLKDA